MAAPSDERLTLPCDDFLKFQDTLKKLRIFDDRIIYRINSKLPTQSFRDKVDHASECKGLHEEMQAAYTSREESIRHCIEKVGKEVKVLSKQKLEDPDNFDVLKALRKEQTKLRLMQQEMSIEEVIKERTTKVFYERCRESYVPPEGYGQI